MRFEFDDIFVEYTNGKMTGDPEMIALAERFAEAGADCSCDFWQPEEGSLDSDWLAYLTICTAFRSRWGTEPTVIGVPDNPAGYKPEGPVQRRTIRRETELEESTVET